MLNHVFVSAQTSVLFIGNSFTYGYGSATKYYRADSVTDLNNDGIGGVPSLFKSFTEIGRASSKLGSLLREWVRKKIGLW